MQKWSIGHHYTSGEIVLYNGCQYKSLTNHTSMSTTSPGQGAYWQSYWMAHSDPEDEYYYNDFELPIQPGKYGFIYYHKNIKCCVDCTFTLPSFTGKRTLERCGACKRQEVFIHPVYGKVVYADEKGEQTHDQFPRCFEINYDGNCEFFKKKEKEDE